MYYDISKAKYLEDYKIAVTFKDGKQGIVNFQKYTKRGGVFKDFASLDFFKKFRINPELGVLVWGDDIDIAPETIYDSAIK